jgi:periplasmic protein TonB
MRRDTVLGIILSLGFHGGLLFAFNRPPTTAQPTAPIKTIEVDPVPPIPPLPPEDLDPPPVGEPESSSDATVAPPSLPDQIGPQVDRTHVQPVQPPRPEGLKVAGDLTTIPRTGLPPGTSKPPGRVMDLDELDEPPAARFQAQPVYPHGLRRDGVSGSVVLSFVVDSSGSVRDVAVVRSTHPDFEAPAIQAVSKWKFRPGRKASRPVNTRMQVPMVFSITSE